MDGRLWTTLYHEIQQACKSLVPSRRAGRPQVYRTEEILVIWVFAPATCGNRAATFRDQQRSQHIRPGPQPVMGFHTSVRY